MVYFKPILYLFYRLFFSYRFGIIFLFLWTILKQFFKSILNLLFWNKK